jgi:predicted  nucleic acid-binding Zn-ribbon protein
LFTDQINTMQIVDSQRYIVGLEKSGIFHIKGQKDLFQKQ